MMSLDAEQGCVDLVARLPGAGSAGRSAPGHGEAQEENELPEEGIAPESAAMGESEWKEQLPADDETPR